MTMYDDVDLPLSGLLTQLASEKVASLNPPCLSVMTKLVDPAK